MLPLILSSTSCSSTTVALAGARCAGDGGTWLRGAALAHDRGARRAAAVPAATLGSRHGAAAAPGRGARRSPTTAARAGQQRCPAATLGSRHGVALAGPRHAQGGGSAWSRGAVLVGLRHPLLSAARAGQQRRPAAMLGSRRGAAAAPGRGAQSSQGCGAGPRAHRARLGAGACGCCVARRKARKTAAERAGLGAGACGCRAFASSVAAPWPDGRPRAVRNRASARQGQNHN
ncbi:uncharacterized protein [Miscanthus floridulus]|uniref:uncharacterized protein n=1 Tax=Miscanthus floridulus TaxID=154761 RepID=UPI00345AF796